MEQLRLTALETEVSDAAKASHLARMARETRRSWWVCWNWPGPRVGGFLEVGTCVATKTDGEQIYCYTELCRVLRIEGAHTIAVIEMPGDWSKNGTELRLLTHEIWPPVRLLLEAR